MTNCHARVTAVLIRPGWLSAAPSRLLAETGGEEKKIGKGLKCKTTLLLVSYVIQTERKCTSLLRGISSHFKIPIRSWRGRKKKQQTQRRNRLKKPVEVNRNYTPVSIWHVWFGLARAAAGCFSSLGGTAAFALA